MSPEARRQRKKDNALRAFVALVSVGGLISFNIWYTTAERREADQRWCNLVEALDDRWRAIPTPAPEARQLAVELAAMRTRLRCEPPGPVTVDPRPSPSAG